MSLRARLTIASAAAVAVAIALASVAAFLVVRSELVKQVDQSLKQSAQDVHVDVTTNFGQPPLVEIHTPPFGPQAYVQVVTAGGELRRPPEEPVPLPVSAQTRAVASGHQASFYADATVRGIHVRIYTTAVPGVSGLAMQLARQLTEVDGALSRLKVILILVTLAGTAVAAAAGLTVARAGLVPVRRLTETAERVTETGDLSQRIEETGNDEIGRLASRFNAMLDALQHAQAAQRQLVADASHELRTPLTSLRTNIEVLAGGDALAPQDRERLLADVVAELEEFTVLVGDLVDLARGAEQPEDSEDVRLDELVSRAVDRAQRRAPRVAFRTELTPSIVQCVPGRIDRAVANLLDNAAKWSPDGGEIEVAVQGSELTVRDHGPGIDPADLPHVFDRFYRASAGRRLPGSGLGLAIVRQVAEAQGGSVSAENAEGGGARLTFRLFAAS
jgi:two-component system, OmpR family, sensor histidine kinase MprB